MNKKNVLVFLVAFLVSLFFCGNVLATQINWTPAPITGATLDENSEIQDLIAYIYGWGINFGVLIAFLMIVIGGVEKLMSGISANPSLATKAYGRIKSAVLGLVLLLSSYLILNTINPQITNLQALPSLWDSDDLLADMIALDRVMEPPCEFVYFYSERDLEGSSVKRYPGMHIERPNYQSVIGYRKMTEEEEELFAELEKDGGSDPRKRYGNEYIEANSCSITLYEKDGPFWDREECGRAVSYITPTNTSLDTAIFDDITCYRIDDISMQKNDEE